MASPISYLALSGIKKADGTANALGTLYFYTPGTNTQATVFWDRDETLTVTQPVTLDSYGRTTYAGAVTPIYSGSAVDIVTADSTGATVGSIGRYNITHAGTVEVEVAGFTGTLTTGLSGDGGRTPLSTVLGTAYTSTNGKDFKFKDSSGGTERALYAVIREKGLSVRDRGAVGDGLTVDTAAFTSAIAIIKAAGGGKLIIPPGTYLIDNSFTIDFSGMIVEGSGTASVIKTNSSSANIFNVSATYSATMRDFKITVLTASAPNTGTGAITTAGTQCKFQGLTIDSFDKPISVIASALFTEISGCRITANSATTTCINFNGSSTFTTIERNYFVGTANAGIAIDVLAPLTTEVTSGLVVAHNYCAAMTKGIQFSGDNGGVGLEIIGNDFSACTSAVVIGSVANSVYAKYAANKFLSAITTDASSFNVASATTPLPIKGEGYYRVTGDSDIHGIASAGMVVGKTITLQFGSAKATTGVLHNDGSPGTGGAKILLAGSADFAYGIDDTLTLIWDGTTFREISRAVI